ncbi:MAG: metallophosphoesterase [Halobacteriaceae archaeon]
MARVEPVPDAPAATATIPEGTALVIADVHAGIEAALRMEGIELADRAGERRERILDLLAATDADRLIVLGDLAHFVSAPAGDELAELEALLDALPVPLTLVPGNHDGEVAARLGIEAADPRGIRLGDIGFVHGHTWPAPSVLAAETVCAGHEHVTVRLADEVGTARVERAWLRGAIDPTAFAERPEYDDVTIDGELVVFPAFNDRSGGIRVNDPEAAFLSPFLPAALPDGSVYLLDGTALGPYQSL